MLNMDVNDTEKSTENLIVSSGSNNILASLQVLTTNLSGETKKGKVAETANDSNKQLTEKPKSRRGRKKRIARKPSQLPILPKLFAIQIAQQPNVIAPVNNLINQNVLHNAIKLNNTSVPQTLPTTILQQKNTITTENGLINASFSHMEQPPKTSSIKAKSKEESVTLAGKFHYASNDHEPSKFISDDVVLSGGLPQQNRRRIVHNATEKRRKEKINGWINKIARVLFKYNPEKQHKIYILEKAYDFISEIKGNRSHEKQEQNTTTTPATNEKAYPELVRKVAELENLVKILIELIKKYKIPTPASLLKSSLVQSKLNSIDPDNFSLNSADVNILNVGRDIETADEGEVDTHINETDTSCHHTIEPSIDQSVSASAIDNSCIRPDLHNQHRNDEMPSVDMFANVLTANSLVVSPTRPISASVPCISNSILPAMENTIKLPDANTVVTQPLDAIVTHHAEKVLSTKNAALNSTVVDEVERHHGIIEYSLPNSTDIQQIGTISSPLLPIRSELFDQRSIVVQDKSLSLPNADQIISSVPLASVPLTAPSSISQERAITTGAKDLSISLHDNVNDNVVTSTTFNSNNKTKMLIRENVAPPSMKSQMFVMKNLVQPRAKSGKEPFAYDETSNRHMYNLSSTTSTGLSNQISKKQETGNISTSSTIGQKSRSAEGIKFLLDSVDKCVEVGKQFNIPSTLQDPDNRNLITRQNAEISQSFQIEKQVIETDSLPPNIRARHSVKNLLTNNGNLPNELACISANTAAVDNLGNVASAADASLAHVSNITTTLNNLVASAPEGVSRKRTNVNEVDTEGRSHNVKSIDKTIPTLKAPPKRPKRSTSHRSFAIANTASYANTYDSGIQGKIVSRMTGDRIKGQESNMSVQAAIRNNSSSLPRPHSVMSLAKHQQPGTGDSQSQRQKQKLSEFSTESLLRNGPGSGTQAPNRDPNTNANQDIILPTILNIFAPASVGNMTNSMPSLNTVSNIQTYCTAPIVNINLPTIHPTFSNFSAEALISGSTDNQQNINNPFNSIQQVNDNMLAQQENQNLFTDFSADTLLAGTESNLSYGIDNIMGRNESSVSSSCISPNWLQTCAVFDNSPIRNSFNPGFNLFDCPNASSGHVAPVSAASFATPVKWRAEHARADGLTNDNHKTAANTNHNIWASGTFNTSQKPPHKMQAKNRQKNAAIKGHKNNKRGPSYGDFLLVDSTS